MNEKDSKKKRLLDENKRKKEYKEKGKYEGNIMSGNGENKNLRKK